MLFISNVNLLDDQYCSRGSEVDDGNRPIRCSDNKRLDRSKNGLIGISHNPRYGVKETSIGINARRNWLFFMIKLPSQTCSRWIPSVGNHLNSGGDSIRPRADISQTLLLAHITVSPPEVPDHAVSMCNVHSKRLVQGISHRQFIGLLRPIHVAQRFRCNLRLSNFLENN